MYQAHAVCYGLIPDATLLHVCPDRMSLNAAWSASAEPVAFNGRSHNDIEQLTCV